MVTIGGWSLANYLDFLDHHQWLKIGPSVATVNIVVTCALPRGGDTTLKKNFIFCFKVVMMRGGAVLTVIIFVVC